jgi:hypothetical protein
MSRATSTTTSKRLRYEFFLPAVHLYIWPHPRRRDTVLSTGASVRAKPANRLKSSPTQSLSKRLPGSRKSMTSSRSTPKKTPSREAAPLLQMRDQLGFNRRDQLVQSYPVMTSATVARPLRSVSSDSPRANQPRAIPEPGKPRRPACGPGGTRSESRCSEKIEQILRERIYVQGAMATPRPCFTEWLRPSYCSGRWWSGRGLLGDTD